MAEKKILESDIQREICDWLERYGFHFWRSNNVPVFAKNNGGKMVYRSLPKHTPRGIPDIIVIIKGRFVGLEVKRPSEKLGEHQESFRKFIMKAGGDYYRVTSVEDTSSALAGVVSYMENKEK